MIEPALQDAATLEEDCRAFREAALRLIESLESVVLGQTEVIEQVAIAVFGNGHVVLEGVPGLAKTLLVRGLARALSLDFRRIQFTPDLLPADILGAPTLSAAGAAVEFRKGPVFCHLLLADEINRAGPKTQSALLEAMQERQVTVGDATYPLERPFTVVATQNPIEQEGTYPLPEAQLDRFLLKIRVNMPSKSDLVRILDVSADDALEAVQPVLSRDEVLRYQAVARQVPIAPQLKESVADLLLATHPGRGDDEIDRLVRLGVSPRGGQALLAAARVRALLSGRYNVSADDLVALAAPAFRHRIVPTFSAQAEGADPDELIERLLERVGLH
jgi:MoxR-like ATPase